MKPFLILASTIIFVSAHAATDPAVVAANKWDTAIAFGAGGYKGEKKVKMTGDMLHTIEPGAFVEGVVVSGERSARWKIDGAYLKDCNFSGDLGTHLTAKNSALENCNLHKNGGWFVQWAGTKWKFDNCLITRSFMPKSFGLHDYAVHARNCTFVGVEMPQLGLRNDPSTYAGKDDNAFIRCRFINCEIPESVLAMSVDCVFESCKFALKFDRNPKKKDIWDEAKSPLKVNAFIVGDSIPNPHVHGQLSVTFSPAKATTEAGAKLPFTQAGGRITVPWSRTISKFNPVGSVDKSSSEIPVFSTAELEKKKPAPPQLVPSLKPQPAPAPEPPPVAPGGIAGPNSFLNIPMADPKQPPPPAPAPKAVPAPSAPVVAPPVANEIRRVEELLTAIPLGIKLINAGKVNPVAMDDANRTFDSRFAGKAATMRIVLEEVVAYTEDGYAYLAKSQAIPVRINGETLSAFIHARVRKDNSSSLSRATKGTTLTIRGTITKAAISSTARALSLTITLDEAKGE